jgi:hypothetical protein
MHFFTRDSCLVKQVIHAFLYLVESIIFIIFCAFKVFVKINPLTCNLTRLFFYTNLGDNVLKTIPQVLKIPHLCQVIKRLSGRNILRLVGTINVELPQYFDAESSLAFFVYTWVSSVFLRRWELNWSYC